MADRQATEPRETHPPPESGLTPEQFETTPEFRRFKRGMKKILKVSKVDINQRIERSRKRKGRGG